MKVAIVLMIIGEEYMIKFDTIFRKNLEAYCEKYGYELIVLDRELPGCARSGRKFFWQRMLLPSLYSDYDYVVSMDSDLYINPNAPAIPFEEIPEGKIAGVNERKYLGNYEWREAVQTRNGWEKDGKEWYMRNGYKRDFHDHLNGGLVIYQPKHHADMFKKLYYDNVEEYMRFHQDDQFIISLFAMDNNIMHWLDERFNRIWTFWREILYPDFDSLPEDHKRKFVNQFIELNYFSHFTGRRDSELINIQ